MNMEMLQPIRPWLRFLPLAWFVFINLLAAGIVAYDKHISRLPRGSIRRVPERRFVRFAWIGGGLGTLLSMLLCHHKTKSHNALLFRIACLDRRMAFCPRAHESGQPRDIMKGTRRKRT